jgi:hypothetical protein
VFYCLKDAQIIDVEAHDFMNAPGLKPINYLKAPVKYELFENQGS